MLATDTQSRELAVDLYYAAMDHLEVENCMTVTPLGAAYQVLDDRRKIHRGHPYRVWTPEVTTPGAYLCDCGARCCEHIGAVLLERCVRPYTFRNLDITFQGR